MARAVVGHVLLLLLVTSPNTHAEGEELRMLQWLKDNGSDVSAVTIGSASSRPGSPRGLLATRDVAAGEVVLSIPVKLALSMGTMTSTTAAEAAVQLLREKYRTRRRRVGPYVDALPTELCTGETLTDAALARVWSAPLRHEVQARRSHTLSVYHAQAGGGQPSRLFDGHAVTLAEFRLAVALVSSRTLAVRAADGDVAIKYMVPLMDMANHRQGSVHQVRQSATGALQLVAGEAVAQGEEIFISYGALCPDETAMHYGFLEKAHEPPAMFATDEPHRDWSPARLRAELATWVPEAALGQHDDDEDEQLVLGCNVARYNALKHQLSKLEPAGNDEL